MAGVGIVIRHSGFDSVIAVFKNGAKRADDVAPALRRGGNVMLKSVHNNFIEAGRPIPWRPLSPAYAVRKARQGYSILPLTRTGLLRRSIAFRVRNNSLKIGTSVTYAPYHQFGTSRMPARPYLIFQDDDIVKINRLVTDHITKGKV